MCPALYLSRGYWDIIEPRYFDGMVGLRHLAICNKLSPTSFNGFHSTWQINLTHLELHVYTKKSLRAPRLLTKDAFKGLDSLTKLTIIDTEANYASSLHLHLSLPNIQQLYLNVSIGEYNVTLDTPHLKVFLMWC